MKLSKEGKLDSHWVKMISLISICFQFKKPMKNKEKKYSPLTAYSIWTNVQRKIQKRCLKKNVKNSSEDLMPITEKCSWMIALITINIVKYAVQVLLIHWII